MMDQNILLVVLDTVRARNVGLHGYANDTTPFLDEFAQNSATHYEQARAPASRSLDSHVSLFTGLSVEEHDVVTSTDKLAPGNTIFDELSEEGYSTGVFSENSWLTDVDAGLKDSFDTVEGPRNVPFPGELDPTSFVVENGQGQYGDFVRACIEEQTVTWKAILNGLAVKLGSDYPNLLPSNRTSTPADTYVDLFLDWADDLNGPWAACLNLMDAHHPYEPKDEHDLWGGDYLWKLQEKIEDVKWEYNGGKRP
jgi:arylsulfatase